MKKQICVGIGISMLAVALTVSAQETTTNSNDQKAAKKTEQKAEAKADPKDQQIAQLNSRVVALQQANEALTERLGKIAETSVPVNQVAGVCKAALEQANPDIKLDDQLKVVKK